MDFSFLKYAITDFLFVIAKKNPIECKFNGIFRWLIIVIDYSSIFISSKQSNVAK